MKIVVDTNRIIAALIKNGTTRDILLDYMFDFVTSDYIISEVNKHKDELKAMTKLTDDGFEIVLNMILERVKITPLVEYNSFIEESKAKLVT